MQLDDNVDEIEKNTADGGPSAVLFWILAIVTIVGGMGAGVAAVRAARAAVLFVPGEELIHRKVNAGEGLAGVGGVAVALPLRNTVVIGGNGHLHIPLHLYDGKETQGDQHSLGRALRQGAVVQCGSNGLGHGG